MTRLGYARGVTEERWSCLVIRVWQSTGSPATFRARLTELSDVFAEQETVALAADPAQALEATRRWLERISGGPFEVTTEG